MTNLVSEYILTSMRIKGERLSADERRATILDAAVAEFAIHGLYGASTETIAARIGISQPYIFRLFGTKKELFIASIELIYDRMLVTCREAAEAQPDDSLIAMGQAYKILLVRRDELLVFLQGFAAAADADVQEVVSRRFTELFQYVKVTSQASDEQMQIFFAKGMLLTLAAVMKLPEQLMEKK